MPKVSIIIPVFDGWDQLVKCLDHLAKSEYRDFETLVIDHGPGSLPRPSLEHSTETGLRVIRASEDLWWTGATNVGIREALDHGSSEYIMLLNHDCFIEPGTISTLVTFADENDRAIVAPTQVDTRNGAIQVQTADTAFLFGFSTVIPPARQTTESFIETRMIIGGRGALIPRVVFADVGLLDEELLPHYGSDNDFYLRCRKAGYQLWVSTRSKVAIDTESTSLATNIGQLSIREFLSTFKNRKSHRNIRDQINLFKKHYPIHGLYLLGVVLNLARYSLIYIAQRTRHLLSS